MNINHRKLSKQFLKVFKHVVVGRNDIDKPLNDADIVENTLRGDLWVYPLAFNLAGYHGANGILLVPYAGMVAARVTRKGNNRYPWSKHRDRQTETGRNLFSQCIVRKIFEYPRNHSQRQNFHKNPSRRLRVAVFIFEMLYKLFLGIFQFFIYQIHGTFELVKIGKQRFVCHPKNVPRFICHKICERTS